jgi:2-aminomuconate deaminase
MPGLPPAAAAASAGASAGAAAVATAAASAAAGGTFRGRRALHSSASPRSRRGLSTAAAADSGSVAAAPKPMGAYAHARRAGDLLFLAGIGPRDPRSNGVPGGPIEAADGSRREYDAAAQTRACIANVTTVLEAYGVGLDSVVDVQCYLVDMKRDFAAFNGEYAAAFGALPAPPTRTTVEVAELPPGGRIAVELKVVATLA